MKMNGICLNDVFQISFMQFLRTFGHLQQVPNTICCRVCVESFSFPTMRLTLSMKAAVKSIERGEVLLQELVVRSFCTALMQATYQLFDPINVHFDIVADPS
jgi:hypothetical protein